jgi:tryptophan synthase alpha chain
MSRISSQFDELRRDGRCALVPYIAAGDPHPDLTVDLMHTLVEAGANIIELGVPFSDPMADGPVIQAAHERSLVYHTSLHNCLDMVSSFREQDRITPVVLMGYANPIEHLGYQQFTSLASSSGVDGVLVVDLPPQEGSEFDDLLRTSDIDPIYLLSPTTSSSRIAEITAAASGFVYYVSLKGVTGAGHLDIQSVSDKLQQIRQATRLPVGVGFGISDATTAAAIAEIADAVVVGSALIKIIEANQSDASEMKSKLFELVHSMRLAMDKIRGYNKARQAG